MGEHQQRTNIISALKPVLSTCKQVNTKAHELLSLFMTCYDTLSLPVYSGYSRRILEEIASHRHTFDRLHPPFLCGYAWFQRRAYTSFFRLFAYIVILRESMAPETSMHTYYCSPEYIAGGMLRPTYEVATLLVVCLQRDRPKTVQNTETVPKSHVAAYHIRKV